MYLTPEKGIPTTTKNLKKQSSRSNSTVNQRLETTATPQLRMRMQLAAASSPLYQGYQHHVNNKLNR